MKSIKIILVLTLYLFLGNRWLFGQTYLEITRLKGRTNQVVFGGGDTTAEQGKLIAVKKSKRRRNCVMVGGGIRFFELSSIGELFSSKGFNTWSSYMISYEIILGKSEINYLGIEVYSYSSNANTNKVRIYVPSFSYRHKFDITDKFSTSFKFGFNMASPDWIIFALFYQTVYLTYNAGSVEWFANIKTDFISGTPTFLNVGAGVQF